MIKVAQITDTHLLPRREDELRGVATWYSLKAVLDRAVQTNPDLLLLTGDLADTGSYQEYRHLLALLKPLTMPVYWLPGNHDKPYLMGTVLKGSPVRGDKSFIAGGWQFILLDSVIEGCCEGRLSEEQLEFLEDKLETNPDLPTLIAVHHHPTLTGLDWVDTMCLQNAEEFLEICDSSQVRLVLFGHIHQTLERVRGNISFYGSPSTCTQVELPDIASVPRWKELGFRSLQLYPDGSHETKVERVEFEREHQPITTNPL